VEYACSLPQLIQGKKLEVSRGVHCEDMKEPLGVVTAIVPFNFPLMVMDASASGNLLKLASVAQIAELVSGMFARLGHCYLVTEEWKQTSWQQ
jgi:hypothetical protein